MTEDGTPNQTTGARYRQRVEWDRVSWANCCANCLATCTYRAYADDGSIRWEEPAGTYPVTEPGVLDRNPMGCQKGAAWSRQLDSPDRVLYPVRRVGERGSGEWERISWDDALREIADAVLDAVEESDPEAVVIDHTSEGGVLTIAAQLQFANALGAVALDSIASVKRHLARPLRHVRAHRGPPVLLLAQPLRVRERLGARRVGGLAPAVPGVRR